MTPASKLLSLRLRRAFAEEIAGPDESVRLESAALLVAAEDEAHQPVDIDAWGRTLDRLGVAARERIIAAPTGAAIEAFNNFLFEEEGFAGNQLDYYDPANSYLNRVLERRVGIPLTLSIVYILVGRRAGLTVEGVVLPGHFIVRARLSNTVEPLLVDPFHGIALTTEDCQDRLDEAYGGRITLADEHLRAATTREILVRLLTNLKAIYMRANLHRRTLACVERLLLLAPLNAAEHRDRGHILAQLERLPEAIDEMEAYLQMQPHAADLEQVCEQLHALKRRHAMGN